MNEFYIRNVVEAALLAAGKSLSLAELGQLFDDNNRPQVEELRAALEVLATEYASRAVEVKETAAGFRIQVRKEFSSEISRLWPERPAKYSRALLETLALIAYRQPITRAEIEAVRGVAVNPNILKTVIERNWVRVVGHRDVPGRPELLGTTRDFLDYFGLRSLDELPALAELKAMGEYNLQLELPNAGALGIESRADGVEGGVPGGEADGADVAGLLGVDVADVAVAGLLTADVAAIGAHGAADVEVAGLGDVDAMAVVAAEFGGAEVGSAEGTGTDVDDLDAAAVAVEFGGSDGDAAGSDADAVGSDGDAAGSDADAVGSDGDAAGSDAGAAGSDTVGSDAVVAGSDTVATATGGGDPASGELASVDVTVVEFEGVELTGPDLSPIDIAEAPTLEWVVSADADEATVATNGGESAVDGEAVATDVYDSDIDDADDDSAADRTLSAEFVATSVEGSSDADAADADDSETPRSAGSDKSTDVLGNGADDDDEDEDELSADGHDSRELVAAPRDIDD